MSSAAKRDRPSKRDVNVLNDKESTSDQPTKKSVKREEESVPSTQVVCFQQETKKEKSKRVLKNDALKEQIDRLTKERAELQARSGTMQESAVDIVDRMEKMGKASFMDLPDDILIRFFKDLDFLSRHKLRFNKRLDGIFLRVKKELALIVLKIYSDYYELALYKSRDYGAPLRHPHQNRDFNQLVQGLNRLSLNTSVSVIKLVIVTNEHNCRIIEALSNFETEGHIGVYKSRMNQQLALPPLNLSILLNLAQNVRNVNIDFTCTSISAQNLCTLRKIMVENEWKLENFKMKIDEEMERSFVKECFGVVIEEVGGQREKIWTKIFRTADESVDFYGDVFFSLRSHIEDGLVTQFCSRFLKFFKTDEVRDEWKKERISEKIEMNHLYSWY